MANAESEHERYEKYLCSRQWGLLKEAVHERSGGVCERCFLNDGEAVHHLTYVRKYNEELGDLIHLCGPCHDFTHGKSDFDPCNPDVSDKPVWLDSNCGSLLCPICRGEYLNHSQVKVYDREAEDGAVTITTVTDDGRVTTNTIPIPDSKRCGNPSSRRHGIAISFHCETCPAEFELTIAQHKGCTYLEWRNCKQ